MKKSIASIIIFTIIFGWISITGQPAMAVTDSSYSWDGAWNSTGDLGNTILFQNGSQVEGYFLKNDEVTATLTGEVSGNKLLASVSKTNEVKGYVEFNMSSDGKEFTGAYISYETANGEKKIGAPPGVNKNWAKRIRVISDTLKFDHIYGIYDLGSSIVLPYENISKITNKETAVKTLIDTTKQLTEQQKSSPIGVDLVTLFAEEALSQASSTKVEGNNIEINSKAITQLQTTAAQTKREMDKVLLEQGITTNREINTEVKLRTESTKDLKITLDKSIINARADKITIESPNVSVKIDTKEIKEDLKNDPLIITITEGEELALEENYQIANLNEIQIAANIKKTYTVNFNRAVKENITVSLPKLEGDVKYQALIKSDGTVVGGKYNPAKNTIDVKIKENGKYTVKENKKDFTDIKNKSQEMQEAIKVLASKGIIDGNTATTFNPDGPISRAEITALIIKTLSKVDKTAEVGFKDITSKDWYYNIAGSSKKYGIINGYDDNTFRGKQQIKKDQIIAVAARTLKTEMRYKDPKDTMIYLNSYKDNTKIASWAKADISLATRENLVLKRVDGNFLGNDYMTRGDAAIIIKRLFDRIW